MTQETSKYVWRSGWIYTVGEVVDLFPYTCMYIYIYIHMVLPKMGGWIFAFKTSKLISWCPIACQKSLLRMWSQKSHLCFPPLQLTKRPHNQVILWEYVSAISLRDSLSIPFWYHFGIVTSDLLSGHLLQSNWTWPSQNSQFSQVKIVFHVHSFSIVMWTLTRSRKSHKIPQKPP